MPDEKAKTSDKAAGDKGPSTNTSGVTTASANPAGSTSADVADTSKTDKALLEAAAASGDADVHNLLAQREIALRNDQQDDVKDIDERLRSAVER